MLLDPDPMNIIQACFVTCSSLCFLASLPERESISNQVYWLSAGWYFLGMTTVAIVARL